VDEKEVDVVKLRREEGNERNQDDPCKKTHLKVSKAFLQRRPNMLACMVGVPKLRSRSYTISWEFHVEGERHLGCDEKILAGAYALIQRPFDACTHLLRSVCQLLSTLLHDKETCSLP
jgi:hypothetical protein